MAFIVVLDACVLYPASLRDILLRLAEVEMYDVRWSQRILNEAVDNLVADNRMSRDQASYLMECLNEAFEDALVPADAIDRLAPSMTNDWKDRHVLAAAVLAGAQHVITSNLSDFPPEATHPHGIEAVHPDDFLLAMLDLDAELVLWALARQAADLTKGPADDPRRGPLRRSPRRCPGSSRVLARWSTSPTVSSCAGSTFDCWA